MNNVVIVQVIVKTEAISELNQLRGRVAELEAQLSKKLVLFSMIPLYIKVIYMVAKPPCSI